MRLAIDNWRWAGVPFYLRTGKRMSRRYSEIAIRFKHAPYAPFEDTACRGAAAQLAGAANSAGRGHLACSSK